MILRRVAMRVRAQDWFAVAIELLIVIFGVFIGIQVANWNEARQDRVEERRYYSQLLVDLRRDIDSLSFARQRADDFDQAAETTLAMFEGREVPTVSPGRRVMAIHHAGFVFLPRAARGTYDELVSTGNLRLLRDRGLKSKIAAYYEMFEGNRQWDTLLRGQQNIYWDYTAGILPRSVLRAAVSGKELRLSVDEETEIWRKARSRPRLRDLLLGMAAHQERVRRDSIRHAEHTRQLMRDIELHLGEQD